ncbi:MAG: hypothetical protein ACI9JN_002130 [Bacteroidia bacterium]|jgi:hypothetical protein
MFRCTQKYLLFVSLILGLVGCGGQDTKTVDELNIKTITEINFQRDQVLGFWQSSNTQNLSFEFFDTLAGGRLRTHDESVATGKIYRSGVVIDRFFWDIETSGTVTLNIIEKACYLIPLNACTVERTATINASGNNVDGADWEVAFDNNLDGMSDQKLNDSFHRSVIDIENFTFGSHVLQTADHDYFDFPIIMEVSSTNVSVLLDVINTPISVTTDLALNEFGQIEFNNIDGTVVQTDVEVFIEEKGYQDIVLREWYENVVLLKSIDNSYTLTFEVHSEVVLPDGVSRDSVRLEGVESIKKYTLSGNLISEFDKGFTILPNDTYNTLIRTRKMLLNSVTFISETRGIASRIGIANDDIIYDFSWSQSESGEVTLDFDNFSDLSFKFVKPVTGGYQVLYTIEDVDFGTTYSIHDFVTTANIILPELIFPGRFIVKSDDGYSELVANFKDDNTAEFEASTSDLVLGGHWFIDVEGDVISFECTDRFGLNITDYETCLTGFSTVGDDELRTLSFGHIRRMRFLHQNGNNYVVKYNAILWGGFGEESDDFDDLLNWTYRFVRVGDWENEE